MPFTDFTTAWNQFSYGFNSVETSLQLLDNRILNLNTDNTLTLVRNSCRVCLQRVSDALRVLTGISWSETLFESYLYALTYFAGQGTVDMDGIINAMLTADNDQLTNFVGIEDAYRSAIWKQPFNAEFYAALARGFMQ